MPRYSAAALVGASARAERPARLAVRGGRGGIGGGDRLAAGQRQRALRRAARRAGGRAGGGRRLVHYGGGEAPLERLLPAALPRLAPGPAAPSGRRCRPRLVVHA